MCLRHGGGFAQQGDGVGYIYASSKSQDAETG